MFSQDTDENSPKMGIRFFKDMPQDLRSLIGDYLSAKDKARVKKVSRDFHGKFEWKTNEKWAKWIDKHENTITIMIFWAIQRLPTH